MKRYIITLAVILSILILASLTIMVKADETMENPVISDNFYPQCGKIVSLDTETDTVKFVTLSGILLSFHGVDDYMVGDIVAIIDYENGTKTITDDVIIKDRYCGYME